MTERNAGIAASDGEILNIAVVDTLAPLPDIPGLFVPPEGVEPIIGHYWTGSAVVPPPAEPEPVPASISAFQARAALTAAGLREAVETAVAGADQTTRDAWEYATALERGSPTIAALASRLGLTDAQIDDLFRAAAMISA